MKREETGKPTRRRSSWTSIWVRCFIIFAVVFMLALVCLAPIFAVVILVGQIGEAIASLLTVNLSGLMGEILAALLEVLLCFAYPIWLILTGEWSPLTWLLLVLLGWLLSVGLL